MPRGLYDDMLKTFVHSGGAVVKHRAASLPPACLSSVCAPWSVPCRLRRAVTGAVALTPVPRRAPTRETRLACV